MNLNQEKFKKRIAEEKIISDAVLNQAAGKAREKRQTLFSYLIGNNLIEEEKALRLLAEAISAEFVDLKTENISKQVLQKVPAKFAWHYQFMPLSLSGRKLTIAVCTPLDTKTQDEIELVTGCEVVIVLACREKIKEQLKISYGLGAETVAQLVSQETEKTGYLAQPKDSGIEDVREKAGEASVIKLVNQIISEAYKKRATDIHIEPYRGKIRLRYRIDGVLFDQYVPEKVSGFLSPIISRIKIMSNLNIVERRVPQDGRALVRVEDQVLDLRISVLPTPHGESVVIRVLPTKMFFDLESLGLSKEGLTIFDQLIKKPNGIVFVTGPTGSGKSTTLYACLRRVNSRQKKIISIEDPIEYEMKNVIQVQVNPTTGLTFAKGLRSMLRHDPDIMMVGEVRDKETAEIAVRVALTGHLVLSTLHTNDAPGSIARLIDIGVEPYLLASSVEAFIAQRLVRVICPECKVEAGDVDSRLKEHIRACLKSGRDEKLSFYKGAGCQKCGFTGFYGRTGVYEILTVDNQIREMIKKRAPVAEIRKAAIKAGMKTILHDCWKKVASGITTLNEALKLSQDFLEETKALDEAIKEEEGRMPQEDLEKKEGNASSRLNEKNLSLKDSFREHRLHQRVEKKVVVQFKLLEKAPGEILKIKEGMRAKPGSSQVADFFGDYLTTEDVDEVYQGVSEVSADISEGGVLFQSAYSIPEKSILELRLRFPSARKSIDCLAKVVRVEKDLPRCFFTAVCFMDISGAERKIIKEALGS